MWKLKFGHNIGTYECFMQIEFGGAWLCDQKFKGWKTAKKGTNLYRYFLVSTDIDKKWFVTFEHTINRLSFG